MKQPQPCVHCGGQLRATSAPGHPWRHVITGLSECPAYTKATPAQPTLWDDDEAAA